MLTFAFREEAVRQNVVFDCSAESRNGMTPVNDAEYSGCLPTSRMYRGTIQNIPDWCRHVYSSCGSAKHLYMAGLPCPVSQRAKLHVGGWLWAVFTRVYLESCRWPVAIFTMDQRKEQRVCIKFCASLGKSATETHTTIQQAFGDKSLSRTQVFQWHTWFKTSRTSVDNDKHTRRATSCTTPETVAWIQQLIRQDQRQTIRDIAEKVGVSYGTCQRVLTEELGMHRVAAKFMPRILTADQK